MDQVQSTTDKHKKGSHLTYDERIIIQLRLKDGWKPVRIAKEIGCAANTVRNKIKRGTVSLYNGHVSRYKAKAGQATYEKNRLNCCRHYDLLSKPGYLSYVEKHFEEDNWSPDACAHRAPIDGGFTRGTDGMYQNLVQLYQPRPHGYQEHRPSGEAEAEYKGPPHPQNQTCTWQKYRRPPKGSEFP